MSTRALVRSPVCYGTATGKLLGSPLGEEARECFSGAAITGQPPPVVNRRKLRSVSIWLARGGETGCGLHHVSFRFGDETGAIGNRMHGFFPPKGGFPPSAAAAST